MQIFHYIIDENSNVTGAKSIKAVTQCHIL